MAIDRIKRQKGPVYRSRVVLQSGRRVSKCFARKIDAVQWEAKVRTAPQSVATNDSLLFGVVVDRFLANHAAVLSFGTHQRYETVLRLYILPHFGQWRVARITSLDVDGFRAKIAQMNCSDSTKAFVFGTLKTLFKKALHWNLITVDPAIASKPLKRSPNRTEYWREHEITAFLWAMKGSPRLPLYLVALNTGMRVGEILGLKWDCVDLESRLIEVRRKYCQKTHVVTERMKTDSSARVIGINDALHTLLSGLKATATSDFVIDAKAADIRCPTHMARILRKDCERAECRVITFHDLRHTYATQYLLHGGPLRALSAFMGHKTTSMSERYSHFGNDHAYQASKVVNFEVPVVGAVVPFRTKQS